MPRYLLAFLAAALLLPALRTAAADDTWVTRKFAELDRKHDGRLTPDELGNPALFKVLDADGDGVVTLQEAVEYFRKHPFMNSAVQAAVAAENASAASAPVRPQEGPKRLNPFESRIGTRVADVALQDLDGKALRLAEYRKGQPLAIALVSPTCPVSKRYLPTLAELQRQGRAPLLLLSMATPEEEPALKVALQAAGLTAPCVRDPGHALAQALGATASTDAFLLDAAQTLVYRGAIDDQYGLGYSLEAPRHRYLADALESTLSKQLPTVPATEAPGCLLDLGPAPTVAAVPTYHGRISRLCRPIARSAIARAGSRPSRWRLTIRSSRRRA